jgi:hypothetical protein
VTGWSIITVLILIALALLGAVFFVLYRGTLRRTQRSRRRRRNGGSGGGNPMDATTAGRIGQRDQLPEIPGPRPWASQT